MAIQSTITIGADVEHLREVESVLTIHLESSCHKNQQTSINRSLLNVLVINSVLDFLETEGLDFLLDILKASVSASIVGHGTSIGIEVDELVSVSHDGIVVHLQELFGNLFGVHLESTTFDLYENFL